MKSIVATPLAILLAGALVVPVAAQDQDDPLYRTVDRLGSAIADVEGELATIDERMVSDDWMVFDSASQGLVQVDLRQLPRWLPIIRTQRGEAADRPTIGLASTAPELWQAQVLLGAAPNSVLEAGPDAVTDWLWECFGHLQTLGQRGALYEAHQDRLLERLEALRTADAVFMAEFEAQHASDSEAVHVQQWCRASVTSEFENGEAGTAVLDSDPPPIDALPGWCAALVTADDDEVAR